MSQLYDVSMINYIYLLTPLGDLKIIIHDNCSYDLTQSISQSLITVLKYPCVHNVNKCIKNAEILQ